MSPKPPKVVSNVPSSPKRGYSVADTHPGSLWVKKNNKTPLTHLVLASLSLSTTVRRLFKICELCQTGKCGATKTAGRKHKLYANQPWQKVATDLSSLLLTTQRDNRWVFLLTDHFI